MMRIALTIIILLALTTPAVAASTHEGIFNDVCQKWGVPQKLALAIARHESGMNPWAVNISGRGYLPTNKEQAMRLINKAWRDGRSFDLGLMQINSAWLRKLKMTPESALEPRTNVSLGVWILSEEIKRHGLSWRAVASYHTPVDKNPERGKRYVLNVLQQMQTKRQKP